MTDGMGDPPKPGSACLDITDGTRLIVRTAAGERLHMIATGRPVRGRDFPVVWVCSASDYDSPARGERSVPWPLDEVEVEAGNQRAAAANAAGRRGPVAQHYRDVPADDTEES